MEKTERPQGVTIICILGFIGFAIYILGILLVIYTYITTPDLLTFIEVIVNVMLLPISIISLLGLYWLWSMQRRGWLISIIMMSINTVAGVLTGNVWFWVGILVVLYLYSIRKEFEKKEQG